MLIESLPAVEEWWLSFRFQTDTCKRWALLGCIEGQSGCLAIEDGSSRYSEETRQTRRDILAFLKSELEKLGGV